MEKRPRRTPAEKARAQYTNYAVKEPMELMEFLTAKMPDASRTKLKSLLSKRVVLVGNNHAIQLSVETGNESSNQQR